MREDRPAVRFDAAHDDRPLAAGSALTATYTATEESGHFIFHPGNVNGDSSTGPLDALLIKPADFDPKKKYPVIEDI